MLRTAERESARELAARRARAEALAEAARRGADASAAVLADPARFGGVVGSFAARLRVAEGYEAAIAAALGAAADAVAVAGLDAAAEILATLRREDAGSAALVIAAEGTAPDDPGRPRSPGDPEDPDALPQPHPLLGPGRSARSIWCGHPTGWRRPRPSSCATWWWPRTWAKHAGSFGKILVLRPLPGPVTCSGRTGPRAAARGRRACSSCGPRRTRRPPGWPRPSSGATRRRASWRSRRQAEEAARQSVAQALARRHEADAAAAEISGRLGRLAGAARAARDEADRLDAAITSARLAAEKDLARLEQLRQELAEAEAEAEGRGRVRAAGRATRLAPGGSRRPLHRGAERRDGGQARGQDRGGAAARDRRPRRIARRRRGRRARHAAAGGAAPQSSGPPRPPWPAPSRWARGTRSRRPSSR